jgi:D-glycero-alpha-D-manno-heptose-7-phosphate kinase
MPLFSTRNLCAGVPGVRQTRDVVGCVRVQAPVRVLDAGGWTDTWFSRRGLVCHLAVEPGAEVVAELAPGRPGRRWVSLRVPDFDDDYSFPAEHPPGRHPLLEAAACRFAPPEGDLRVAVECAVPAGSSLGTSASVAVALVAALQALADGPVSPAELARAAHELETVDLGRQSGVQDQVAAAFGGASLVRVSPYPHFEVEPLAVPPATWGTLGQRVVTAYLGAFHDSSAVHETVIAHLEGDAALAERLLDPMREAAAAAANALSAGDLAAYGRAMAANTDAQAQLHPSLVNPLARRVISLASAAGAVGWKVNGAGGPGGTVTLLGPEGDGAMAALVEGLKGLAGVEVLALRPASHGARVVAHG